MMNDEAAKFHKSLPQRHVPYQEQTHGSNEVYAYAVG